MIILQCILQAFIFVLIYAAGFAIVIVLFSRPRISRYYQERKWKRVYEKREKEHEEFLQLQRKWELEWKLRKEERKRYPLFYWRESTDGNP